MLAHRLLGGCNSSLCVSCPSLLSALIAVACAHLWSSFSGALNPLSSHTPKQWSLASLADPDFSPHSLPASCGALAPFRLCSRSQLQSSPWDLTSKDRASAPSPHPPGQLNRQASRAGECWLAPILCAGISPLCPLHRCCCALLCGSKAFPLRLPQSPSMKGLPSVWKLFLLHSSLPEVQVPSLFFCLCFFLFSFALPRYVGSFLPFGKSEVFCQHSVGVL